MTFPTGGYRSSDPVFVTIVDRKTRDLLQKLRCGNGKAARALAVSSDGTKLVTVHDLTRPDVRVWTLREYPHGDVLEFWNDR